MRFLKELVYTGEEKETLDIHTRKMVLRHSSGRAHKDVFLFTPLKRRTARDNERKISQ